MPSPPLLFFLFLFLLSSSSPVFFFPISISLAAAAAVGTTAFTPPDNFLIDCGASSVVKTPDGRSFTSDPDSASMLSTHDNILVSVTSSTAKPPSSLYLSARIFTQDSTYTFQVAKAGWHWIRLHFLPINNTHLDLTTASSPSPPMPTSSSTASPSPIPTPGS